jgi:hypothetical protein
MLVDILQITDGPMMNRGMLSHTGKLGSQDVRKEECTGNSTENNNNHIGTTG